MGGDHHDREDRPATEVRDGDTRLRGAHQDEQKGQVDQLLGADGVGGPDADQP